MDSSPTTESKTNKSRDRKRKMKQLILNDNFNHIEAAKTWTQCAYFMTNKRRFCNVSKCPNSEYCGTHRPIEEHTSEQASKRSKSSDMTRIPCPVDNSHTIFLYNLHSHIKICNITTRDKLLSIQPYYCFDCNSGPITTEAGHTTSSSTDIDPNELLQKVYSCFNSIQSTLPPYDNRYLSTGTISVPTDLNTPKNNNTINSGTESNITATATYITSSNNETTYTDTNSIIYNKHPILEKLVIETVAKSQSSPHKLRHALQDVYIVQTMVNNGLITWTPYYQDLYEKLIDSGNTLESRKITMAEPEIDQLVETSQINTAYIELGAGKGYLGLAVSAVRPLSTIVLVERSGMRNKADKLLTVQQQAFYRARMDIRHCLLNKLPGVDKVRQLVIEMCILCMYILYMYILYMYMYMLCMCI